MHRAIIVFGLFTAKTLVFAEALDTQRKKRERQAPENKIIRMLGKKGDDTSHWGEYKVALEAVWSEYHHMENWSKLQYQQNANAVHFYH